MIVNGEITMPWTSRNVKPDKCALEFNNWSGNSFTNVIRFEFDI